MTNRQARKLAREIVDDIMTCGTGDRADRLALRVTMVNWREDPGRPTERDLGGWGRDALFDRILGHLTRYTDKPGKPRPRRTTKT